PGPRDPCSRVGRVVGSTAALPCMPNRRRSMALFWAGLLATAATRAPASELSERLVARGQLAYDAGRYEEAHARFAEAADADPHHAVANYDLGLSLLALERWDEAARAFERALALRPDLKDARRALETARTHGIAGVPEKRWEIHAATGVGYDTNVKVA